MSTGCSATISEPHAFLKLEIEFFGQCLPESLSKVQLKTEVLAQARALFGVVGSALWVVDVLSLAAGGPEEKSGLYRSIVRVPASGATPIRAAISMISKMEALNATCVVSVVQASTFLASLAHRPRDDGYY